MAGTQIPNIERIIAETINKKASGDPDAMLLSEAIDPTLRNSDAPRYAGYG